MKTQISQNDLLAAQERLPDFISTGQADGLRDPRALIQAYEVACHACLESEDYQNAARLGKVVKDLISLGQNERKYRSTKQHAHVHVSLDQINARFGFIDPIEPPQQPDQRKSVIILP